MIVASFVLAGLAQAGAASASASVKETAYARVARAEKIAGDPAVGAAVVASNAVVETAEEIRRKDAYWIANRSDPLRKVITGAPCSGRVRELVKDDAVIVEAFVMNNRGTLVCSINETSDYWQGDEAKWIKTYQEGREAFVEEPAFDASTGTYAIQVSVPVSSAAGKRIGAVTLTLKLRRETKAAR